MLFFLLRWLYVELQAAFARRKRRKAAGGNRKGRFPPDPLLSFAACIRGCFAGRLGFELFCQGCFHTFSQKTYC